MSNAKITPIELTADAMEHLGSSYYYLIHIFNALREHKELLESPDYQRLYDEARDFLFRYAVEFCGWHENEREWGYHMIERIADLSNSCNKDTERYSVETLASLLAERRKVWELMQAHAEKDEKPRKK
ncbi:MAG: hypothetical protein E7667_07945 [Ruminococcaceae bacterium]|nr:hypothetical protein [Oscillospiraceae bacterium]